MSSGTVVPPPSRFMLPYFPVLTVEGGVRSYGVWYRCAPSLLLDTAVFSRLMVEGTGGSYGVWYCCAYSLPSILWFFSFNCGAEDMVLPGLVLLCPFLPPP